MYISIERCTIQINRDEGNYLFHSLVAGLRHTITSHWRKHKECWPSNELCRLGMLEEICRFTGHNYPYELKLLNDLIENEEAP